jgi:hypothetical protein
MPTLVDSIRAEYLRYKALAEAAIAQVEDGDLSVPGPSGGNSLAAICWHVSGNLRSRFTDFLDSDGEKPWRAREEEFQPRTVTRAELQAKWSEGWDALFGALATFGDEQLHQTVTIRGQPLHVHEALHRSLAHASYHVGQIVYLAKSLCGDEWTYLSIPPGKSDTYNQAPVYEKASAHEAALAKRPG